MMKQGERVIVVLTNALYMLSLPVMETLLPIQLFSRVGENILLVLLILSCFGGIVGMVQFFRPSKTLSRSGGVLLLLSVVVFSAGFFWIGWFHYRIYLLMPLELPASLAEYLNRQLEVMNRTAAYGLPLYNPDAPPRYMLPLWLEHEKYYFWFMCYSLMALVGYRRLQHEKIRSVLLVFLAAQVLILFLFANPFAEPLPKFFEAITPWFTLDLSMGQQFGLFMQLYPKMIFYYNAEYMWFHPPLLFLSYACITMVFVTSVFMLINRDPAVEKVGYDFAKLGFFLLTLGMLLGYPWALKAWGPNWWWDPKICSSIMMWAVYSTYLHTRLYVNKPFMWYFSSILGIVCFLAMIFTFVSSFFFPGEHTFV